MKKTNEVKFGFSYLTKKTPAWAIKIAKGFVAVSTFIVAYGLATNVEWAASAGLVFGIIGTFVSFMFSDVKEGSE